MRRHDVFANDMLRLSIYFANILHLFKKWLLICRFNEEARPWCQKKRGRRGDNRGGSGTYDFSRSADNRQPSFATRIAPRLASGNTVCCILSYESFIKHFSYASPRAHLFHPYTLSQLSFARRFWEKSKRVQGVHKI